MTLNGIQIGIFMEALLDGFRSKAQLSMMIQLGLNENLDTISTGENLEEIVFSLIRWADSRGQLSELADAAHQGNPANVKLKRLPASVREWINIDYVTPNQIETGSSTYIRQSLDEQRRLIDEFVDFIISSSSERPRILQKLVHARLSDLCTQVDETSKTRLLKIIYKLDFITSGQITIDLRKIDFTEVDLANEDLENADLVGANLSGAIFKGANLTNVNFTRSELWGADFTFANLRNACFAGTNLTLADLTGADLTGADLTDARLDGAILGDSIAVAGQVWAGIGDVDAKISELAEKTLYRLEVLGKSMVNEQVQPGDEVVIKVDSELSPKEKEMLVLKYLPQEADEEQIDPEQFKITLKVYWGQKNGYHYLGWKKGNARETIDNFGEKFEYRGNDFVITTRIISPIGRVVTVYRKDRKWIFTDDL